MRRLSISPRDGLVAALFAASCWPLCASGQASPAALPRMPLAPAASSALPAAPPLVVEVIIRGNTTVKDHEVQKHIQTRRDRELDPETLQGDVRRLITSGLFRDVRPTTEPVEGGVVVIFQVVERPRIHQIKYLGNRGISDKKLNKEVGVKEGDPLNSYLAEEARRKIEELYHQQGYPHATVSLLEGDKPGDKDLVFLVNEGQLERIAWVLFEGNTIASDDLLRTKIKSKPGWAWLFFGGKVDRAKIDEDIETLTAYYRSLGFFRARIGRELSYDDSGKWLTLKFVIDEGPRYKVRNVAIEGNTKFASGPLLDFLELKAGEYFNQLEMNKDLNTLTDIYGSQGHVFADVQADPRFLEEPGQLDMVYRIKEGDVFSVGEIHVHIAGEYPHTRQTVVLNRLSTRPGDIIDMREINNSERRLKLSQLFEVNPAEGEPPRIVVRPPDLAELEGLANRPPPTVRGQEPDPPAPQARRHSPYVPIAPEPPLTPGPPPSAAPAPYPSPVRAAPAAYPAPAVAPPPPLHAAPALSPSVPAVAPPARSAWPPHP